MTALPPVSGLAVGGDGSVYVSEYGVFDVAPEGYSRPSTPGQVKVKRPNGEVVILAKGIWRARVMALHDRTLYLCSESDREDHGNAAWGKAPSGISFTLCAAESLPLLLFVDSSPT